MSVPILVIGAINVDILGTPSVSFVLRDSNIGHVHLAPGGVGRNIAEHLARHGASVTLLAWTGIGPWAEFLQDSLKKEGIACLSPQGAPPVSSVYLAIHDEQGDMVAAVNDMRASEMLTPAMLRGALKEAVPPAVCVLEANLPAATLAAAASSLSSPLVADPVSGAKANRLLGILPSLTAIKPNLIEAEGMTGESGPQEAARVLLRRGVAQVYVSLGADGLYYATAQEEGFLPAERVPTKRATGAGDAMTAGIALALSRGESVKDCARLGLRLAGEHLLRVSGLDRRKKP